MNRPPLDKNISPEDFRDFYWLKEELVSFCKKYGICSTGGKIDIAARIEYFLKTGQIPTMNKEKFSPNKKSKFDWNKENLSPQTLITDNYKNSENVRQFFTKHIGDHFSFNVRFMQWMKENVGKTLADAAEEWNKINIEKKDKSFKTEISPQFEYNRYMRAFLEDNPDKTSKDAMRFWKLKRELRGSKEYKRTDLELQ